MNARASQAYPPLGMGAAEAAAYVGMSQTAFLDLVDGPDRPGYPRPPKPIRPTRGGGRRIWRRPEIEAWYMSLPSEGELAAEAGASEEERLCDALFGIAAE